MEIILNNLDFLESIYISEYFISGQRDTFELQINTKDFTDLKTYPGNTSIDDGFSQRIIISASE